MSQPNPDSTTPLPTNRPPTLKDLCLKAIFDNQDNLNILTKALQQQMVYINSFLQSIEKQNDVSTTVTKPTTTTDNINNNQTTEGAGGGTGEQQQQTTDQSTDTEYVPTENKDI